MPWGFIGRKAFNAARSRIGRGMKPKKPRKSSATKTESRKIQERHKNFNKQVKRRRKSGSKRRRSSYRSR